MVKRTDDKANQQPSIMSSSKTRHVLIFRTSAIGDVTMAATLLREYAKYYPQYQFTMVSQAFLQPLFEGYPNLQFIAADLQGRHHGFRGIFRLFFDLRKLKVDCFVDLHSVLRSLILRTLFFFSGTPVYFLIKGRSARQKLTRQRFKKLRPIKTMFQRYESVLHKALGNTTTLIKQAESKEWKQKNEKVKRLGIAPFAKHQGKLYPLERMESIVSYFAAQSDVEVFLFGGGDEETRILAEWESRYDTVVSMAGKLSLAEELLFMQKLSLMVSMDSANMHFASFVGIPVVSIWGATHPFAGFYGWKQCPENAMQMNLYCRPCSIFGNKDCFRNDYTCMRAYPPTLIIRKIEHLLETL